MKILNTKRITNLIFGCKKTIIDIIPKKAYTKQGKGIAVLEKDTFTKNNNIGKNMFGNLSSEEYRTKLDNIMLDNIKEIDYAKIEREENEYQSSSTDYKYYDKIGVLRKATTVNCNGNIKDVELYNQDSNITYSAYYNLTNNPDENAFKVYKVYYDGTEEENIIKQKIEKYDCNTLLRKD